MRQRLLITLALCICFAGCSQYGSTSTATPVAPSIPPQVTVANSMLALSHAVGGATDALIACRQLAKCSPEDVTAGENVISAIATAGKQIDSELASSDAWTVQQTKILGIISQSGLAQLKARVSPSGQLLIVAVVTLYDNISLAVGGPTF